MKYPRAIENLINEFSRLPTVGPKTAERYVFYLLKKHPEELTRFSNAIKSLKDNLSVCKNCFTISEQSPCLICSDSTRTIKQICVISRPQDMISIENTKEFTGHYHVLGGEINTIEGIEPKHLTINQLIDKLKSQKIEEVLLALSPTLEGETTSMYISKLIKKYFENIKISRLAKGLPMGANLEYADNITISNAIKYRNTL